MFNKRIDLSTWETDKINGELQLGKYILISPGTSIRSAKKIIIGDSTMIASDVTITDSDWHDIYDRTQAIGRTSPVTLGNNVWIGDGAIVCKGVSIGDNSIIGAGSVVTQDIPSNVIAAGNPAKVLRPLDPAQPLTTRRSLLENGDALAAQMDSLERWARADKTWPTWLRSIIAPTNKH